MAIKVIDISKHQQSFHPAAAKSACVDAVMLRHAYGTKADDMALSWASGIKEQSLPLGGYGFATWHYKSKNGGSVATARALMHQQVQSWIDTTKQSGCDFWFAVDQELERGQQMGLGKHDNTMLLNEACDMLAASGLHPCIYCSVAWDNNYIRTADLRYNYWLARYYDGTADFGAVGAELSHLPDGKYTRWMRQLQDAGRLVGWQFASTGCGHKYGAGSENIDRNVFYMAPAVYKPELGEVHPQSDAQYIAIGPLSSGDQAAVHAQLDKLQVPAHTDADGVIYTDVALSTGDQVAMIHLATTLLVPIRLQDVPFGQEEQPEPDGPSEQYSVVFMSMVVKGGFASAADARDYIEAILGKDAMERLSVSIAVTGKVA